MTNNTTTTCLPRIYFWRTTDKYGFLSNWYESPFKLFTFNMKTSEHAIMAMKAYLFEPEASYNIFDAPTPRQAKELGRKIKNFDENLWNNKKVNAMYLVNFYKYTQNPDLLNMLYQTAGYDLVEASPKDKIWGSGLSEEEHIIKWNNNDYAYPGQNLLGKVLTKLRDDLIKGLVSLGNLEVKIN